MLVFFIGFFCIEATRAMTMVQIPIFLREIGASVGDVGLFFTLSMIFILSLRIIGGWVSDSFGRLRALWLGSLIGIFAYIPYVIADRWEIALLGPILLAVASGLTLPSFRAYIADATPDFAQGRMFGISSAFRTFAWIVAPPIGGYVAFTYGSRWTFLLAGILFITAAMIYFLLDRTEITATTSSTDPINFNSFKLSFSRIVALVLSGGLFTWIIITDGLKDVTYRLSFDLMPIYLNEIAGIGKQGIGFLDGIHGIAWVVASPIGGALSDRTSERIAATLGLGLLMAAPLTFALATDYWGFALSWILIGVGSGFFDPAINALIAKGVDAKLRGIAYALVVTSVGLVSLASPWIGARLWETFGPKVPYILTVLLGSLALIPAWTKLRVSTKEAQEEQAAS
jgi:MFS family permease